MFERLTPGSAVPARARVALRRTALATLTLLTAMSFGAGAAQSTLSTQSLLHDVYGFLPDQTDARSLPLAPGGPSLESNTFSADNRAGGFAYAVTHETRDTTALGSAALARASGNLIGSASAAATVEYKVRLTIGPGTDFLFGREFSEWTRGCINIPVGCEIGADFIHETKGRFLWSANPAVDSLAHFEESLTVAGKNQAGNATYSDGNPFAGSATLHFDPFHRLAPTFAFSGGWNIHNLTSIRAGSAASLDLFAPGDPRNALNDPHGPLQGASFLHETLVLNQNTWGLPDFDPALSQIVSVSGEFIMTLAQLAQASFGPDAFSDATLAVDFAHTSTFKLGRVFDPSGRIDLSLADITVAITPLTAVPLPGAAGLLTAALIITAGAARRRRATTGAVRRCASRLAL